MDYEQICVMLAALASVLNSLKLLRETTSREELESIVTRAFLEGNLDHRKGMTNYEVMDWFQAEIDEYVLLEVVVGWPSSCSPSS